MKDICYIIGAGECKRLYINEENKGCIIAADGGMQYLENAGIKPDLVIGDFDSLGRIPTNENTVVLPAQKDVTDMNAAIDEGFKRGFEKFIIYGAMGGRFDHSIANCQLLNYISLKGGMGILVDENYAVTFIRNGWIKFDKTFKGLISIFSSGTASKGVSIEGLKYRLTDGMLRDDFPLGTSNEFMGTDAKVTVCDGKLLVVFETTPVAVCDGLGVNIEYGACR